MWELRSSFVETERPLLMLLDELDRARASETELLVDLGSSETNNDVLQGQRDKLRADNEALRALVRRFCDGLVEGLSRDDALLDEARRLGVVEPP